MNKKAIAQELLKIAQELVAVKPRRGWNGKLDKIDKLLSWMYDKGILSKGEKNRKDSLFRQYYRYYNDGDYPGSLRSKGISKYDTRGIEYAIEESLEEFTKSILLKYLGKIDRAEFRLDQALASFNTLLSVLNGYDASALLSYWSKKINPNNSEFDALLKELEQSYAIVKNRINDIIENTDWEALKIEKSNRPDSMYTTGFNIERLKMYKLYDRETARAWSEVKIIMDEMIVIVKDVITATKALKKVSD